MASTKESIPSRCQSASVRAGNDGDGSYCAIGQTWEQKDHPLLNDLILSTLFQFMGKIDLKQCRLVCKKWCTLTLPSTRSKFILKLHGNSVEITRRLTDFVEVFRANEIGIPFEKYNLDPFCTTEGPGQEFLQICGNTAKKVCVYQPEPIIAYNVDVEDISEILKAMPNIEMFYISHRIRSRLGNVVKLFPDSKPTLKFLKEILVWDPEKSREYCPTFIEEILSIAPNISDFKIKDCKKARNDLKRSRIEQVLRAIEKFGRESVIRNLNFVNGRTEHLESIKILGRNGMKLKKLEFVLADQRRDTVSIEIIPELAKLFKNSIERLCVQVVCPSFIQLPRMPRLDRLEFCILKEFDSRSIDLNKLCPSLKVLDLSYWDNDDESNDENEIEELLPNSEPCPNVNSLTLGQFVFKIQLFNHILNIFPKLTKLDLEVQPDSVQILTKIMTQMTQLEDLSVWGTIEGIESIDSFYTGIPIQILRELEHVVMELKEMTVQLRAETIRHYRTRYCQSPSIANLTNLKCLHLSTSGRVDEEMSDTHMTDVFLYFGLYSMESINKLQIINCEFTKSGCEILTEETGLKTWRIQDDHGLSIIPDRGHMYKYE